MKALKAVCGLFIVCAVCSFAPQAAWSQTEKLGIVQYTPPEDWTKTPKENVVAFSQFDQDTGKFCILTLYGATFGSGNPRTDFTKEWNNLVVKNMKAQANPKTDVQRGDGWTAISGGAEVESDAGKAVGFLTVISGFGRTISVLAVFNDPAYAKQVGAFIDTIELDKITAPAKVAANTTAPKSETTRGNLVIPIVTRQLTLADLAGEWGENSGRIATEYVNTNTGRSAGTDSLHYISTMTITKNGGWRNNYFAVRNGKKESDDTVGTISIAGRVISTKRRVNAQRVATTRFVVIGWLERSDATIMTVSSNFFEGNIIPQQVFTNDDPRFYSTVWVRKK
jgi:hypothetical protein